jgi:hypothetical protein
MSDPKNQLKVLDFIDSGYMEDGLIRMPTLWTITNNGKFRYWELYIGIGEPNSEKMINVNEDYINRKSLPVGHAGVYWTISGLEGSSNSQQSDKKWVTKGKSPKSKAFTTPFTQAVLDAKSDYDKRIKGGSTTDKSQLRHPDDRPSIEELIQSERGVKPWRIFPMAMHDLSAGTNWNRITYPCKLDPKLDGTLVIIVFHPKLPAMLVETAGESKWLTMDSYTRGRKDSERTSHILWELYPILKKYPGLHLVGELWKSGYGLQEISGSSRRQLDSKISEEVITLDFNVFDCFFIDKTSGTEAQLYEERLAILDDLFYYLDQEWGTSKTRYVKKIETQEANNREEVESFYRRYLEEGMEGIVVRNFTSPYEVGVDKEIRSFQTLKLKPRMDEEYPVVNYTQGTKGKEVGAVIWICCENDKGVEERLGNTLPNEERKTFSVTPNWSYELRNRVYDYFSKNPEYFAANIQGKLATINYSILSNDSLPQQPKMKGFHDQDLQKTITKL